MRFVNKDLSAIPAKFNEPLVVADFEEIAISGNKELIKDSVYKDTYIKDGKTESRVRDELNKYYHSKCAYCEMHCKAEIEHYRPKKSLDGTPTHGGYYWLCYEWSNLVPSCRYCNTEGGKGSKFPIIAERVCSPTFLPSGKPDLKTYNAAIAPLIDERPYLIHPEIDNPKNFFIFEQDADKIGIKIKGKDSIHRGEETIRICNLNRPYVRLNRMEAVLYPLIVSIDKVFQFIEEGILEMVNVGKALALHFKELEEQAKNEKLTHTLMRWFIIKDISSFEVVIAPLIRNSNQRDIVIEAFKNYKYEIYSTEK